MIKVNYDEQTGVIKGFYPNDVEYSDIPQPLIEINQEQWQELINNQGKYIVQNGELIEAPIIPPKPPTIDELLDFARQKRESALKSMAEKYPAIRWELMTEDEKQVVKELRTLWLDVTTQIKEGLIKDFEEIIFPKSF